MKNSNSSTKIFSIYQNLYSNDVYDIVLIFSDTDDQETPSESNQYQILKNKIKLHHDIKEVPIIIFSNPCTMQIILSHFDTIRLSSRKKKENQVFIEKYANISNYKASAKQIESLMKKISKENYKDMKERVKAIKQADNICPSSNFYEFLEYFENKNCNWIDELNSYFDIK